MAAVQMRAQGAESVASLVGVIGLDVPLELVAAGGMRPVPIASDINDRRAEAMFDETHGHPRVRALLSTLLSHDRPEIGRLLIGSTPSYLTVLFHVLRSLPAVRPETRRYDVHLVDLQHGRLPASAAYNIQTVQRLRSVLEEWSGRTIDHPAVTAAIERAKATRSCLARIATLRTERRLSGADALRLFDAALASPDPTAELGSLIAALASVQNLAGKPLVYSGIEAGPDVYEAIESAGYLIVADDQEGGARRLGPPLPEDPDPIVRIARGYAERPPTSARWSIAERCATLLDLVRRSGAQAVLFNPAAFEHPAAWDQPNQIAALDAAGVAHFVLDPRSYERPDGIACQLPAPAGW